MTVADGGDHTRGDQRVSAVLSIGSGAGALLVDAPPRLLGAEIEVVFRPTGRRDHAVVEEWAAHGAARSVALFPELAPGPYEVLGADSHVVAVVHVVEGAVVTTHMPQP